MKDKKNKKGSKKFIDELFGDCASANECTGLYQKVSLDREEIERFHREFNGGE